MELARRKDFPGYFVKIEFVPLEASLLNACRDFNARLRAHGEPPFELPEEVPGDGAGPRRHWVAVDEERAVRGGVLLQSQQGWLNGGVIPLINVQSPLSEAIIDRRYSPVGPLMLKFLARQSRCHYAVGMGSLENPFARLVGAAGWQTELVPFFFHVADGTAFLREIGPLRDSASKRPLARIAAALGIGAIGASAWRATHSAPTAGYSLEAITQWSGANEVWASASPHMQFGLLRNEDTLPGIFPPSDVQHCFLLRHQGRPTGWSAAYLTPMRESRYFGNLRVGTILDGLAAPEHVPALLTLTRNALRELFAQLIVINQCHEAWLRAMPRAGFLAGPSNYVAACAKAIRAERRAMHITRADGDGRIHL
jgi:hypothetical protein